MAACCENTVNLCVARFASEPFEWDFFLANGVDPLPLSGYGFLFQVRDGDGAVVLEKTTSDMTVSNDDGTVALTLTGEETGDLTANGTYVAGMMVTKPDTATWAHPDRIVFDVYTPPAYDDGS